MTEVRDQLLAKCLNKSRSEIWNHVANDVNNSMDIGHIFKWIFSMSSIQKCGIFFSKTNESVRFFSRRSRKCQKYVRMLSRLSCVRGWLIFESMDCHHIYMLWSFLISFWNTSLIALGCLFFFHVMLLLIISLTSRTRDWNRLLSLLPKTFGCHLYHLFLQLIVQFNSLSIKSIIIHSNFSSSAFLLNSSTTFLPNWCCLFDKWNVKWIFGERCKGFHPALVVVGICVCVFFFLRSCLRRISSSMNFVFLWTNLILRFYKMFVSK